MDSPSNNGEEKKTDEPVEVSAADMTAFENILKMQGSNNENKEYGLARKTTYKKKDFRTAVNFDDDAFRNEDPVMIRQAFME